MTISSEGGRIYYSDREPTGDIHNDLKPGPVSIILGVVPSGIESVEDGSLVTGDTSVGSEPSSDDVGQAIDSHLRRLDGERADSREDNARMKALELDGGLTRAEVTVEEVGKVLGEVVDENKGE